MSIKPLEKNTEKNTSNELTSLSSECVANQNSDTLKNDSKSACTAPWLPPIEVVYNNNSTGDHGTTDSGSPAERDRHAAPTENVETKTDAPLTDEQKRSVRDLQDTLSKLLPVAFDNPAGQTKEAAEQLRQLQEGLKNESGLNDGDTRFGENTKKAYETFVNWLQQRAIPGTLKQFDALELQPTQKAPGNVTNNEGKVSVDLGLNTNEVPTEENLTALGDSLQWLVNSQQEIAEGFKQALKVQIVMEGLPQGWLEGADTDPDWTEKAARHITLAKNVRDAVQAQMEFGKATRYNDLSTQLPPGAKITTDENGRRVLDLDLPKTLDENDPANFEKFNKNNWWFEAVNPRLQQIAQEALREPLIWGDIEIQGMKARLDDQGRLIDFVDPKTHKGKPGEPRLRDANLLENRFDVNFNTETGKYEVTYTVQAQNAFLYLNMDAENVGKPKAIKMREYDPDDFVHIQVGQTSQLVRARDLEAFKSERQTAHYGEKVATVVGDVAMVATGTIELGLIIKAGLMTARATGLTAAAARRLALPALNAVSDIALGASGFALNSAGARDSDIGHVANQIRNFAFMGKAGQGLLKSGLSFTRFGGGSSVVEEMLRQGGNETGFAKLLPNLYKNANRGGEWITYGSVLPLYTAVNDHLRDISQRIYDVRNGQSMVDQINHRPGLDNQRARTIVPVPEQLIKEYGVTLGNDRPADVQQKITNIMNGLNNVLREGATEEQKQNFKQQMADILGFSKDEIKQLEVAQAGPLNGKDLSDLSDTNKRQDERFRATTRAAAEKILAAKDPDIRRAAELALLLATAAENVGNDQPLASRTTSVEASVDYGPFPSRNGRLVATPMHFEKHDLVQNFTRDDLRKSLYRQFEKPMDDGRQIVLAHALLAAGVLKQAQFNSVVARINAGK